MRKLSAGANRWTCQSLLSKASESDAYHSSSRQLMLESAAFTLAMSARATSTPAGVGLWAHPGLANDFAPAEFAFTYKRSLRIYIGTIKSTRSQYISQAESFDNKRPKTSNIKGVYGGLHFKSRALTKLFA